MNRVLRICVVISMAGFLIPCVALAQSSGIVDRQTTETGSGMVTTGKFRVFENRADQTGKQINLNFVVLHARNRSPRPDPLFFFAGGPGQAVTTIADGFRNSWVRNDRDIVLVDQRGTAGDHNLAFQFRTEGNVLQQYMEPVMAAETVRTNLDRLKEKADLRMFSTPMAADDVNDFRQALGYDKINISGGSYGTRFCLVYLRRHGETVRTATLAGCAPIEFKNPLYHAEGAQRALDLIFDEVENSDRYRAAFGDLRKKFDEIVDRLAEESVTVEVTNQSTGNPEPVQLDLASFLASVRFQMYYTGGNRELPKLLCDAYEGNFRPFVISALQQNTGLRQSLALGMLLSVTAAEDLARIEESEIDPLTRDTFFGDSRVRSQIAAGKLWPKSELPDNFGEPVKSDVPTLILSGELDPVTPPKWGEMIHENFPNSLHVVVPTAHDIGGECVRQMRRQFLESGTVQGLDIRCVDGMKLPPLALPN